MLNKIKIVGIYIQYLVLTVSIGFGLGQIGALIADIFLLNKFVTLIPLFIIVIMYTLGIKEHFIDSLFELNNIGG